MLGMEIGRVAGFTMDQENQVAVVELKLKRGINVYDDAIASIKTAGLIGDRYVSIDPGGAEDLLEGLRNQGYEIHALSNYPVWFHDIERRLELSRFIEWSFVSCLTGIRKPDTEAFLGAACSLERQPEDCVLIDDSLANCAAAEAVNMPTIHFTNSTTAWAELVQRGYVT